MGVVEAGAKKKRKKRNLQHAVMFAIGTAGLLTVAAVAPNTLQLLDRVGPLARLKYQSKKVLTRLKQKGAIQFVERDGVRYVRLTKEGNKIFTFEQEKVRLAVTKPRRWDRRYRLVIFDVPEKRKRDRERLRAYMQEAGFLCVQDSVWLYPYDCEDFMALLKAHLHIGKAVLYAVVENIEHDKWIRAHFHLPPE